MTAHSGLCGLPPCFGGPDGAEPLPGDGEEQVAKAESQYTVVSGMAMNKSQHLPSWSFFLASEEINNKQHT